MRANQERRHLNVHRVAALSKRTACSWEGSQRRLRETAALLLGLESLASSNEGANLPVIASALSSHQDKLATPQEHLLLQHSQERKTSSAACSWIDCLAFPSDGLLYAYCLCELCFVCLPNAPCSSTCRVASYILASRRPLSALYDHATLLR